MKRLFALVLCLCMVLTCAPGVAAQTANETVEAALAAAPAGGKISLQQDTTAGQVLITKGVTLDLNGYALTADMVIVFDGQIIDSKGTGKVIVAKDMLAVMAESDTLPVWNGEAGCYTFATVAYQQVLNTAQDGSYAQYIFIPNFDLNTLALLKDGSADNGISVKVLLSWNDGASVQSYTFSDALVAQVYGSANANGVCSRVFQLTITGIAGITDMTVCAVVESSTGGKLSNAPKEEKPEALLPMYTGRYQGQEFQVILEDDYAYALTLQHTEATEEDLAEANLTGTLYATIINKQKFNKVTVEDGIVSLSDAEAGYYTAYKITGTAAEGYMAYVKALLAERVEAGSMSQEEHDMLLTLIQGEDIFYESESDANLIIDLVLSADGLINEIVFKYPHYTTYATCEYHNGTPVKETITEIYADDNNDHTYYEINYYADGKTLKQEESYYIEKNADGEWEQTQLHYMTQYRENGSRIQHITCWDGIKTVAEYNEKDVRIKATSYNADGQIVAFEECYANGNTKIRWEYNEDGTKVVEQFYENGDKEKHSVYDAEGTLVDEYTYTYEYYEDGVLKEYTGTNQAGQIVEFLRYTYYANGMPETEIGQDLHGNYWEYSFYESGERKAELHKDGDGSGYSCEYYPDGSQKQQIYFYPDGTKTVEQYDEEGNLISHVSYDENGEVVYARAYVYEYYDNGKVKSRITKNMAGEIIETDAYTYYEDGSTKTSSGSDMYGNSWETEYYEDGGVKVDAGRYEDGTTYRNEYYENGNHKKLNARYPDGSGYEETYDENGNLTETIMYGQNGEVESRLEYAYEYDEKGNVIKRVSYNEDDELVESKEYTYYENGSRKTEKGYSVEGNSWEYGYDEDGCMITEIVYNVDGSGYQHEYYEHGKATKLEIYIEADGSKTVREYDEHGNSTRWAYYDAEGVLTEGFTYTYEYTADGNIQSYVIKDMVGEVVGYLRYTFYDNGSVETEIRQDEYGNYCEFVYDEEGYLIVDHVLYAEGYGTRIEYYPGGQIVKKRIEFQPSGCKEVREYDEQSNLTKYTYYDENGEVVEENTYIYEYYPNGATKSRVIKDMEGNVVESESYTYYEDGTLATEIGSNAMGIRWENEFYTDGSIKRERRIWTDESWEEYEYYENGGEKMFRYRNPDGTGHNRYYDLSGHLVKEEYLTDDGSCWKVLDYVYEFDDNGRVKTQTCYMDDEFYSSNEYTYYESGATKSATYVSANGYRETNEYNENGTVARYIYSGSDGSVTTYEYSYFAEYEWQVQYENWYNSEGSRGEKEYYENGLTKYEARYDANGELEYQNRYDSDGNLIED